MRLWRFELAGRRRNLESKELSALQATIVSLRGSSSSVRNSSAATEKSGYSAIASSLRFTRSPIVKYWFPVNRTRPRVNTWLGWSTSACRLCDLLKSLPMHSFWKLELNKDSLDNSSGDGAPPHNHCSPSSPIRANLFSYSTIPSERPFVAVSRSRLTLSNRRHRLRDRPGSISGCSAHIRPQIFGSGAEGGRDIMSRTGAMSR